jgi:hypothetical protein
MDHSGVTQAHLVLYLLKYSGNREEYISRVMDSSGGRTHLSLVQVSWNLASVAEGSYRSRAGVRLPTSISVIAAFLMMSRAC